MKKLSRLFDAMSPESVVANDGFDLPIYRSDGQFPCRVG